MKKILIVGIIIVLFVVVGSYFYKNMTYIDKPLNNMYDVGITEKQIELKDGTVLNYGEGPDNGETPLLFICLGQWISVILRY